ncbi:hypothetical protein J7J18_06835 [bacterium]|nr:hypothetical protein [bacterium]
MKFRVPPEWIEKWITKGGRRVPIIKKEFRQAFLWTFAFARKSPLRVVDSRSINETLEGAGFETFRFLENVAAPHPEVRRKVLPQADAFLNFFIGSAESERAFRNVSLSFHRYTSSAPIGCYVDAYILRSTGKIERELTQQCLEQFSANDRVHLRHVLGITLPKVQRVPSEVKDLAEYAFPQGSGAISMLVYSPRRRDVPYDLTFLHECCHFVQSQLATRAPDYYVEFGRSVYAPYLQRVLPEAVQLFQQATKHYGSVRPSVRRNFVRLQFYRALMDDPFNTSVISIPSLQSPEEGFSEAFSLFAHSNLQHRRFLRLKWPEARDYFATLEGVL